MEGLTYLNADVTDMLQWIMSGNIKDISTETQVCQAYSLIIFSLVYLLIVKAVLFQYHPVR